MSRKPTSRSPGSPSSEEATLAPYGDHDTTPRLVDLDLVADLRRVLASRKACVSAQRKAELEGRLEDYLTACKLAKGPDAGRSKHWAAKADDLHAKLARALDGIQRAS